MISRNGTGVSAKLKTRYENSQMNLLLRTLVAIVGIPAIYFLVRLGSWYFVVFVSALAALAAHEFFSLAKKTGLDPLAVPGTIVAGLLPAAVFLCLNQPGSLDWLPVAGAGVLVLVCLGAFARQDPVSGALARVAVTFFGIFYLGVLISFQVVLRYDPRFTALEGFNWVFLTYVLTWSVDTGSYLVGRLFGRHKMCPRISPGKTVEGLIGGVLLTIPAAWAVGVVVMGLLSVGQAVALALLIGVVAPVGDLLESVFKRDARVKDSSVLIPGHGGVLDRFDSLILTVPLAVFFRLVIT